ncbi:O-antigen synthesis protein WbyH [Desulfosarcina alkanivorans]|uniref:O-antigen synthesis protein WbyH n=1 Tax=Desulfosarcina alkanivorans TaxID=571177 RepID=A0A5K7YC53_9BACT|nr:FAD-dependent oxidoreductase [Desulfosarcina alkanivorans]BBO66728.1 O-antigen synthesis protein WbyH [Desulfosarcina alkanivorans]
MIVVLGAGIAGLSAAYHLGLAGREAVVYEKSARWGGLCDSFEVDGFRFDHGIHLSFTKDDYVRELFGKSSTFHSHAPRIGNLYKHIWIKHPAQNNLCPLSVSEKVRVIKDFVENDNPRDNIRDYEMWLRAQYGNYFAEHFPMAYTRKYWTVDARDLEPSWVGEKMYRPELEEVLAGAMTPETPNTYYADEMRYPVKGGYRSFLSRMANGCEIGLDSRAVCIDLRNRKVLFEDGREVHYESLISSIPLPELIGLIEDAPASVAEAGAKLTATSSALVSLGLKGNTIPPYLWFYIYDEDFLPARCSSPGLKSPQNVPAGCSSLQFEIHFSKHRKLDLTGDDLVDHVVAKGSELNILDRNAVIASDCRCIRYANVLFEHSRTNALRTIHSYLDEVGIIYCGRFGKWDYLWSDQSLMSGKQAALNRDFLERK